MSINNNDPEYDEYDDDDYNYYPEYDAYGYPANPKKFDVDWSAGEKWLKKAMEEIIQEDINTWLVKPSKKFPVSDGLPKGAWGDKYFAYLGSNHYEEAVWKRKYFVIDEIDQQWKKHIQEHAVHFVKNPSYYKGLHDILN